MIDISKNKSAIAIGKIFLIVFYLVGVLGFSLPETKDFFKSLIPLNLLINIILLLLFHKSWNVKTVLLMAAIVVVTFLIELVGVNTHWLFGNYQYGQSLGFKVFGTPLLIGVNWLILTYCFYASFSQFREKWYFVPVVAGLMVGFDFFMEPIAILVDMWTWHGGGVPLKNYLDWFWLSAVLFLVMKKMKLKIENEIASYIVTIQFLFFVSMNFILR